MNDTERQRAFQAYLRRAEMWEWIRRVEAAMGIEPPAPAPEPD